MVADIAKDKPKQNLYYASLAYLFFLAVRLFGKYHFNYHD